MKRVNENVAIVYIILGGMFATVLVATCRIKALFAEMNDRDIRAEGCPGCSIWGRHGQ